MKLDEIMADSPFSKRLRLSQIVTVSQVPKKSDKKLVLKAIWPYRYWREVVRREQGAEYCNANFTPEYKIYIKLPVLLLDKYEH